MSAYEGSAGVRAFLETGVLALDLMNTWDEYLEEPERLPDPTSLRHFLSEHGLAWRPGTDDLQACRALRAELRAIVAAATEAELVGRMERLAARVEAVPTIAGSATGSWRLSLRPLPRASIAERLAVRAVAELTSLLEDHGADRMRTCAGAPCVDAFVDTSRNGTRRYCSRRCANRVNAATHRARIAGSA
jgi:predicted RNA-binding Zn ribbon-like protein